MVLKKVFVSVPVERKKTMRIRLLKESSFIQMSDKPKDKCILKESEEKKKNVFEIWDKRARTNEQEYIYIYI